MKNRLLQITRGIIGYVPELKPYAKTTNATLLWQQLDYWFAKYPNGFYKFLAPCKNKEYTEGDSWCEELAFSKKEFKTAFSQIGFKYTSKKQFDEASDKFKGKYFCAFTDKIKGLTYYYRNHELADQILDEIVKKNTDTSIKPRKPIPSVYGDGQSRFTETEKLNLDIYTETTTETTTDTLEVKKPKENSDEQADRWKKFTIPKINEFLNNHLTTDELNPYRQSIAMWMVRQEQDAISEFIDWIVKLQWQDYFQNNKWNLRYYQNQYQNNFLPPFLDQKKKNEEYIRLSNLACQNANEEPNTPSLEELQEHLAEIKIIKNQLLKKQQQQYA